MGGCSQVMLKSVFKWLESRKVVGVHFWEDRAVDITSIVSQKINNPFLVCFSQIQLETVSSTLGFNHHQGTVSALNGMDPKESFFGLCQP